MEVSACSGGRHRLYLAFWVGFRVEQRTHERGLALVARHPKRCHAGVVHLVHVRPGRKQHEHNVRAAAVLASLIERSGAIVTRLVRRRARLEQQLRHLRMPKLTGRVECGSAALRVAPVEVRAARDEAARE